MPVSPHLAIQSVLVAQVSRNSMLIPMKLVRTDPEADVDTTTLLDSGAGGTFIDQNFVRHLKLETKPLEKPLKVFNVDGTPNKKGTINRYVEINLIINRRKKPTRLLVTGLG